MVLPTNDFTDGDILTAAQLNNNFQSVVFNRVVNIQSTAGAIYGLLPYDIDNLSGLGNGAGIKYSSDEGVSWAVKDATLNIHMYGALCKDDKTKAFCVENLTNWATSYTTDKGVTWTAKTVVPIDTVIYDISFPTAAVLVVAGVDAGGDYIIYSVDQGTNWVAPATNADADVWCMDMWSGTIGYAITSGSKIFKSGPTVDDWTDTTDSASGGSEYNAMVCISETEFIYCNYTGGVMYIRKYDNTAHTNTELLRMKAYPRCLGIKRDSNGIIYAAFKISSNDATELTHMKLLRSTDDGDTWAELMIPFQDQNFVWVDSIKTNLQIDNDDNVYISIPQSDYKCLVFSAMTEP